MYVSRFLGLGLVLALQSWNASGAMIYWETYLAGVGATIEEAEADLRSQIEAMTKVGNPAKDLKELARCTGGGYSATAMYLRKPAAHGEQGTQAGKFAVCGHPSWESAMMAVNANCMREFANIPQSMRIFSGIDCKPEPGYHDRFQTKERWFFSSWFNDSKLPESAKPAQQVNTGTSSYDGRYAPDCTKIGLALDIHDDSMTLSENGRVLFSQNGKLLHSYWGNTPPPGGEAGFSGKRNGDPAFEIMRQGGELFGNINPSKQLESLMAGRPLKGYRYCGLTCNSGKAEVSGGNIVCRR